MNKFIFNHLYSYLHTNNLITKHQSAFPPGDSTSNLYLIDEIHQAFDCTESFEVRAVFLVWHEGLVFKLEQNGILGRLLKLFQNYLNNRKQRVVLNGYFSEYSNILSPLLFLICTNDLEQILNRILNFLLITL